MPLKSNIIFVFFHTTSQYLFLSSRINLNNLKYGPFSIKNETTTLINFKMDNRIEKQLNNLTEDYLKIKLLNFGKCPGGGALLFNY